MAWWQRRWVRGADAGRGPSVCFTRSTPTSGLVSKKPPQKQTSLMLAPPKQAPHLGCRERKIKSMFMLLLNCPTGGEGTMLEGEQLVWLDQWWWSYNIKIWQYTKAQFLNILPVKICHVSVLWTKLVNCLWEPRWRDIRSFSNSTFLHLFFLSILIYDYICKYMPREDLSSIMCIVQPYTYTAGQLCTCISANHALSTRAQLDLCFVRTKVFEVENSFANFVNRGISPRVWDPSQRVPCLLRLKWWIFVCSSANTSILFKAFGCLLLQLAFSTVPSFLPVSTMRGTLLAASRRWGGGWVGVAREGFGLSREANILPACYHRLPGFGSTTIKTTHMFCQSCLGTEPAKRVIWKRAKLWNWK